MNDEPVNDSATPFGIAKLAAALAIAQAEFTAIPKDREVTVKGDFGSYKFKYATMDAIMSATRPALAKNGLAVVQGMIASGNGYAVETKLLHSSGEWLHNVTPMFVTGRMKEGRQLPPSNQELGSAQTYARRYGLSALLCITADEDDDGNTADGNSYEGREAYRPAKGSVGAGGQFRPEGRRQLPAAGAQGASIAQAREDIASGQNGSSGAAKGSGKRGPLGGREATPAEARAAKLTAATDKRIKALMSKSAWTRDELDQLWKGDATWIDWMSDPANEALAEYERFTNAFAEAELTIQPVELA